MKKPAFKILSIDGGGIRGIIPATIIAEIERRMDRPACRIFDLIAGTSTGGILACGLVIPDEDFEPKFTAEQLSQLYEREGNRIFKGMGAKLLQTITSLFKSSYPYEGMEEVLEEYFGEADLKSALKNILVTSYDLELRKPMYFKSRLAKKRSFEADENFLMRQIARATSAAPTFFPPSRLLSPSKVAYSLIDGGVFANNPSVLAYAEAKELFKEASGRAINDMPLPEEGVPYFMLSLGTGNMTKPYAYEDAKGWGAASWIRPILDILFQGVSETVDYQMKYILPDGFDGTPHYRRINPEIPAELEAMDNAGAENIAALKAAALQTIAEHSAELDIICELLD